LKETGHRSRPGRRES